MINLSFNTRNSKFYFFPWKWWKFTETCWRAHTHLFSFTFECLLHPTWNQHIRCKFSIKKEIGLKSSKEPRSDTRRNKVSFWSSLRWKRPSLRSFPSSHAVNLYMTTYIYRLFTKNIRNCASVSCLQNNENFFVSSVDAFILYISFQFFFYLFKSYASVWPTIFQCWNCILFW